MPLSASIGCWYSLPWATSLQSLSPFHMAFSFVSQISQVCLLEGYLSLDIGSIWIIKISNLLTSSKIPFKKYGNIHRFQGLGSGFIFWGHHSVHYTALSGKCSHYIRLVLMAVVFELQRCGGTKAHFHNVIIRVPQLTRISLKPTSIRSTLI